MESPVREAAQRILASVKRMATNAETYVPAREAEFTHLDLSSYREFQSRLEARGYRLVGDFELLEVTNDPDSLLQRTMIRTMLSADGTIVANHYRIQTRKGRLLRNAVAGVMNFRIIAAPRFLFDMWKARCAHGFESQVGETFLITYNGADMPQFSMPASVDRKPFPRSTPLDSVCDAHEQRLATARILGGVAPTVMTSYDDILAMGQRLKRRKDAHRAASKWITRSELLAHSNGDEALADLVFEEVQKILAEETASAETS
jgi:hypothetical protein